MKYQKPNCEEHELAEAKILILILSSKNEINIRDEMTQRETWATNSKNCRIIWIRGDASQEEFYDEKERTLYVQVEEKSKNILEKTILAMRWAMKQQWQPDIIIRSNVSTYFKPDKLVTECTELMRRTYGPLIAGYFDRHKEDYFQKGGRRDFVSGAGIFLNKKAVNELLRINLEKFREIPDDVAISIYLLEKGVSAFPIRRCNMYLTGLLKENSYIRVKSSVDSDLASIRMKMIFDYDQQGSWYRRSLQKWIIYRKECYLFVSRKSRRNHYFRLILSLAKNNLRNYTIRIRYP